METLIGIDLGTSTTEAAVIQDGKAVMILNFDHQTITPSVVGIDGFGNYVVGEKAKAQLLLEPKKTVMEVKRKLGTDERIALGKDWYTPVELSSMLLSYVKRYASEYLNEEITHAVISVPAYFNNLQRQATVEAGEKAGLSVERIINEPTAAALSYGMDHMEEESHILVYDLGGGTFDVTLLELFGGVLEVKASSGDNSLGGKDFDERIMEWLTEQFYEKHGIHLSKDIYAMAKLKEQAELCKIALSSRDSYEIKIPFIAEKKGEPLALEETVTTEKFTELIGDLIEKTHRPIDIVMADSGISPNALQMVLLVGGSTRMPLVQKDIEDYLGMKPSLAANPDYAVAEGAAVQAGILSGAVKQADGLIMTDVNPFTLGIRVMDYYDADHMSVIIPRNVTIPVTKTEIYCTSFADQEEADIDIYQGEFRSVSRNHFLGKFRIGRIPPNRAGEEKIEVAISYDQNGMLEVTATVVSTGKAASVSIDMMQVGGMPENRMDVSRWKEAPGAKKYRTIIRRAEKLLGKQAADDFEEDDLADIDDLLYLLKKAILEDSDESEQLETDLFELLSMY